jgi:uncharacterized glyoxalase superfamily protein PhnB
MIDKLTIVTLIVRDQAEALKFYTEKLGFEKRMDSPMGDGMEKMRWLTMAPKGGEVEITLQSTSWFKGEERERMEKLVGQNPTMVFSVTDCRQTYEELKSRGVPFRTGPEEMPWGMQAMALDLYGNELLLVEPPKNQK